MVDDTRDAPYDLAILVGQKVGSLTYIEGGILVLIQ